MSSSNVDVTAHQHSTDTFPNEIKKSRRLIERDIVEMSSGDVAPSNRIDEDNWLHRLAKSPLVLVFQPRKLHAFIHSFPQDQVAILLILMTSIAVFVAVSGLLSFHIYLSKPYYFYILNLQLFFLNFNLSISYNSSNNSRILYQCESTHYF
jgi:hypothetical protein